MMVIYAETCIVLSRVRGLRDKNKRGVSGFNEGVYLNYCRDYTQQIYTHSFALVAHKLESSGLAVVHPVLVILRRSLLPCAPESGPQLT
jgi:hypothetical protein